MVDVSKLAALPDSQLQAMGLSQSTIDGIKAGNTPAPAANVSIDPSLSQPVASVQPPPQVITPPAPKDPKTGLPSNLDPATGLSKINAAAYNYKTPLSPQEQIWQDQKDGKISYQQALASDKTLGQPVQLPAKDTMTNPDIPPPDRSAQFTMPGGKPVANPESPQGASILDASNARPTTGGSGSSPTTSNYLKNLDTKTQQQNLDYNAGRDATLSIAKGFQNQTQQSADEMQKANIDYSVQQSDEAKQRKDMQIDNNRRRQDISDKLDEEMAKGIDPNRMYNNMNTSQHVLAGIGMLLGGIGGAVTHGNNAAVSTMENAINRDIDAQKAEATKKIAILGKKLDLNDSGFNQNMALMNAQSDATYKTYNMAIQQIKTKMDANKDNSAFQMQAQQTIQALKTSMDSRIDHYDEQAFQLRKQQEAQATASAGPTKQQVRDVYAGIWQQAVNEGKSDAEASAIAEKATRIRTGASTAGLPSATSGTVGALTPETITAESDLKDVQEQLKNSSNLTPEGRAQLIARVNAAGITVAKALGMRPGAETNKTLGIPDPTLVSRLISSGVGLDPLRASVDSWAKTIQNRKAAERATKARPKGTPDESNL